MAKNLNVNDELYNYIISLAEKESITIDELLNNLINNGHVNDYSNFSDILLEDTQLFNYRGGQSTVFNRFRNNNIKTLKELFELYDLGKISYGAEQVNENFYIHEEIKGIIQLLQFKYLGFVSEDLISILNFNISGNITAMSLRSENGYGYPGKIFNLTMRNNYPKSITTEFVNSFYKMLKSCGFDQTSTKVLIDYAFENKINNICLGEFLLSVNYDEIKEYFKRVPQEYPVFINIQNILVDFYTNSIKKDKGKSF